MLRAEVTWGHSIALSGILAAALYLWLTSRSRFRYPAAVICGATVLLSGSRSGLLCMGIAVGLAMLRWSYGSATRQLVLPALFAAVGVSVYAFYSDQDVQTRMSTQVRARSANVLSEQHLTDRTYGVRLINTGSVTPASAS